MFFPLKDENPTRHKPYVTISLISLNILAFLLTYFQGGDGYARAVYQFGLIPYEIVHLTEMTPQLYMPVYITAFTSMFLHGGFMHLGGNMLFLWIFGNNIEDHLGPVRFIIFYLVSGLAAVALFVIFSPNAQVPLIGASGAIAGVLGAYLVLFPNARIVTLIWIFFFIRIARLPAKVMLGFWFFYQLLMSFAGSASGGGVAWMAHVGGFAFGWLLFKFMQKRLKRKFSYDIK